LSILSSSILNIRTGFKQLLPAQPCLLCGALTRDGLCCSACEADLSHLAAQHCPICALPVHGGDVCGQCLQQPPHFDRTVAAFSYSFPLSQLIKALKFHERLILANFLADKLAQRIITQPDVLIALPLHPARLRERGFNQSQLLAARIARRINVPLLTDACRRVRDTPPQSSLPWKERDRNMRQAFVVADGLVYGKHIAIVDDVMTTGASMGALAHALKQAGASEVSAWVVARTLPHHEKTLSF
jgi:ComF family protein